MSSIRNINLEADLPTLRKWWEGHKAIQLHPGILPQGWMIVSGPVEVAAAFLFLDVGGKLAVVEFLTTNPAVAFSRHLVEDVRALIAHIEQVAKDRGCFGILSAVVANTGEARLMNRMGYVPPEGPPHDFYFKRLKEDV